MRIVVLMFSAALSLLASTAFAQDKAAPVNLVPNKKQSAEIQRINARYDAQIMAAFAGQEKLVAEMQSELKAIDQMKDPAAKKVAITTYQRKYTKTYQAALAKGKVDLAAWAAALNAIMPGVVYKVSGGTHLLATASSNSGSQAAPAPRADSPRADRLNQGDFAFERTVGCGGIAGGSVTRSVLDITSETFAAVAGGCENEGVLSHEFDLPSDKQALVELGGDTSVDAFAVGVVGSASAVGSASFFSSGRRDESGGYSSFCSAIAPVFWVGHCSQPAENVRLSFRSTKTGSNRISAVVIGQTISILPSGTSVTSKVRYLSAKITLSPR
jgi:hypothetical protein